MIKITVLAIIAMGFSVTTVAQPAEGASSHHCLGKNANPVTISQIVQGKEKISLYWDIARTQKTPNSWSAEWGGAFVVGRCLGKHRFVQLASGVVTHLSGTLVGGTAELFSQQTPDNLYPSPMIGDVVIPVQKKVARKVEISPVYHVSASRLFERLHNDTFGVDLSEEGKLLLSQFAQTLTKKFKRRLLVEAYINRNGDDEEWRMLSQVRADAVEAFLRKILPEETHLTSSGLGNDQLQSGMQSIGEANDLEGIILRAVPY